MKKIKISIGGAGYEIVQSEFSEKEIDLLDDWCKENDDDREGAFIYSLDEIFEDRSDWWECDDLGHHYGASLSGKIYLEDNDGDWQLEITDVEHEVDEINNLSTTGTTVCCVSWEKGSILNGEFEIGDDEKFDESKLKLEVKEIMTPDSIYEVVTGFSYDGKEIMDDGPGDTTGKGFDVEID
jgi:hypothetical protein|tara:strand:+ start:1182 stop:1727 length:546 start_codon:yes stop_codon:yes gene_type:complete